MDEPWFRLCVDLDYSGNVLGGSFEVHDEDVMKSIVVIKTATEEDMYAALTRVSKELQNRYAVQGRLF